MKISCGVMDKTVAMVFCALLAMAIGACTERDDSSSVRGGQVETVTPAGTRTVKQMEAYEKTHPLSKEKRVMPVPGTASEQDIDVQFQSDKFKSK